MLTLKEAIANALERGSTGDSGIDTLNGRVGGFNGRFASQTDTIRAFAIDPALINADIERSLSKFDARVLTSMTWQKNDAPVVNFQQQISNGDAATISSTLAKPLPTGGVAGITFSTDYRKTAIVARQFGQALNPTYTPRLQFLFEQPLMQSFGIEINQIAQAHPGSSLIPGLRPSGGQTTEGILITKIRSSQAKAEFDRAVNTMLLNVENAYWDLYSAYHNLHAREKALQDAAELLFNAQKQFNAGVITDGQLAQVEAQYWRFRSQVDDARDRILRAERILRNFMGENSYADGMRIVPADEPTVSLFEPNYYEQANEMLANRPELIQFRHELKVQQFNLMLQKNQRRPDLRFFGSYDIAGIGNRLDGSDVILDANGTPTVQNAFANFANNDANSWQLGLRLDIPLGFRDANAAVYQARLQVLRLEYGLRNSERVLLENVVARYREFPFVYRQITFNREVRQALERTQAENRRVVEAGAARRLFDQLQNILQVQSQLADAEALEFQAIANYNKAIAAMEFEKGTIQRFNNVTVGEGPLPIHVQKKASDHFRERGAALKLRERPSELPLLPVGGATVPAGGEPAGVTPYPAIGGYTPTPMVGTPLAAPPGKMDEKTPETKPMPPATAPSGPVTLTPWQTTPGTAPVRAWPTSTTGEAPPAVFTPLGTAHIPTRKVVGGVAASPAPDATPGITVPVIPTSNPK